MKGRSYRRHHAERIKAKARRIWYQIWGHEIEEPCVLEKVADSIPTCSCWMCGNPRRHFNKQTRQELKADNV